MVSATEPPGWRYDKNDLAAFRKWKKRIEMWALQVVNYVPKREAGILLFNSLKGELEEELEDAPLEKIFDVDGVTFIMDTIQKAVETRSVHLKRQLLNTYEHIYRAPQETMRSFVNRYAWTERAFLENQSSKFFNVIDPKRRQRQFSKEKQRQRQTFGAWPETPQMQRAAVFPTTLCQCTVALNKYRLIQFTAVPRW